MKTFTNDIGQLLTPGDECVVVTMCTKSVNTTRGIFIGWSEGGNVQAQVPVKENRYYHKKTGEKINFLEFVKRIRENAGPYKRYNEPGFDEYISKSKDTRDAYEIKKEIVRFRVTTLHNNMIYKICE